MATNIAENFLKIEEPSLTAFMGKLTYMGVPLTSREKLFITVLAKGLIDARN